MGLTKLSKYTDEMSLGEFIDAMKKGYGRCRYSVALHIGRVLEKVIDQDLLNVPITVTHEYGKYYDPERERCVRVYYWYVKGVQIRQEQHEQFDRQCPSNLQMFIDDTPPGFHIHYYE